MSFSPLVFHSSSTDIHPSIHPYVHTNQNGLLKVHPFLIKQHMWRTVRRKKLHLENGLLWFFSRHRRRNGDTPRRRHSRRGERAQGGIIFTLVGEGRKEEQSRHRQPRHGGEQTKTKILVRLLLLYILLLLLGWKQTFRFQWLTWETTPGNTFQDKNTDRQTQLHLQKRGDGDVTSTAGLTVEWQQRGLVLAGVPKHPHVSD